MSNSTRLPANRPGVDPYHFWTSTASRRKRPVRFSQALNSSLTAATTILAARALRDVAPEREQKRMPSWNCRAGTVVTAPEGCPRSQPTHRLAIADLVEPDGIEPTTSCLQSRRSPN
jgi:hypothetical protein